MRVIRRPVAVLVLGLSAVACTADAHPQSPSATAAAPGPLWTPVPSPGISRSNITSLRGGAGWNGGFVLAGDHTVPITSTFQGQVSDLYTSPDGSTWTEVKLEGLGSLGRQTPVAGYQESAYVLGDTVSGAAVWRSEDGTSGTDVPLLNSEPGEALSAVAAGAHGVVVVGFDRPISSLDEGENDTSNYKGLRVWWSADGKTFDGPRTIEVSDLYGGYLPDVAASADGFTIFGIEAASADTAFAFSSVDGKTWIADDPGSMRGRLFAVAQKGNLKVAFTDPANGDDDRPTAWRRSARAGDWTASHDVTVGWLPDANVDVPEEQTINSVAAWQGWFVATGSSAGGGGAWLSSDGAHWERFPVTVNGFGVVDRLSVFANDSTVLVAGDATSHHDPLKIWKITRAVSSADRTTPPSPTAAPPPVSSFAGTWVAHAGKLVIRADGSGSFGYRDYSCHGDAGACSFQSSITIRSKGSDATAVIDSDNNPHSTAGQHLRLHRQRANVLLVNGAPYCRDGSAEAAGGVCGE